MGRTPIVFREPGVDPSLDEIPLRSVSARPLITCGVIAFIVVLLACGGLFFVSARSGTQRTPEPTPTTTPDEWEATGTQIAYWTPTFTPTASATPTDTPTPTMTLDAWDMTGTAVFWLTYTPTPTYTASPRPTSDRPPFQGISDWWANVRGTAQARRTEMAAWATVTAQAITPTGEPPTPEPVIQYVEVTRVTGGGGNAEPEIRYVEVTPIGYRPPPRDEGYPTLPPVTLPTVNPTYYVWLTWTKTPTAPGVTPTASATASTTPTPTTSPSPTVGLSPLPSETPTHTALPPTSSPTETATPTPTSTETATDAPIETPMPVETLNP